MTQFSTTSVTAEFDGRRERKFTPITKYHFQLMLSVMLLTLLFVVYQTQFGTPSTEAISPIIDKADLVIRDDSNGDILVTVIRDKQASDATEINQVLRFSGEQGFLRGTLRALARDRRMRNLTSQAPFELALHADGRLSITDTLTAKGIDLQAFGADNAAIFADILSTSTKQQSTQ